MLLLDHHLLIFILTKIEQFSNGFRKYVFACSCNLFLPIREEILFFSTNQIQGPLATFPALASGYMFSLRDLIGLRHYLWPQRLALCVLWFAFMVVVENWSNTGIYHNLKNVDREELCFYM